MDRTKVQVYGEAAQVCLFSSRLGSQIVVRSITMTGRNVLAHLQIAFSCYSGETMVFENSFKQVSCVSRSVFE